MSSAKKKWIVITSGDQPLDEISKALTQKGFSIESTMDAIGQITGEASEAVKKQALKIPGVTDIVSSHDDINIGNPDSETTW